MGYTYDAWGNILSATGTRADNLGKYNPLRYRGYVYDVETELYYLQSRYYDPEWGRFLNADVFVSTGQGLLGNNMFVYCLNNPLLYCDTTGMRAEIWPILFGNHDPGYIHRAVQMHILFKYTGVKKELVLTGVGRADIYDSKTMELWEIKHGGNSVEMQNARIMSASQQIRRYIDGAKQNTCGPYREGHAGAFEGEFAILCNDVQYLVAYTTPQPGVILYTVQQLNKHKKTVFATYPLNNYNYSTDLKMFYITVGAAAVAVCLVDMFSSVQTNKQGFMR